ncbi:hypothetical protein [Saliphagus sp. LR7]|uniref:hypothetical protein n=1 Tax=Saliphagus sp. LR7 TaxID=2282654 RepID=UPI000DF782DC|nr:hypothetical protein [Saliphagus sp. LR7]
MRSLLLSQYPLLRRASLSDSHRPIRALEYGSSDPQGADEVPDGVVEHPNPEGFRWIAVAVNLTGGEIPSGDLYGLTQIGVGDATKLARAVDIEDGPLVAGADNPTIEGGGVRTSTIGSLPRKPTVRFGG